MILGFCGFYSIYRETPVDFYQSKFSVKGKKHSHRVPFRDSNIEILSIGNKHKFDAIYPVLLCGQLSNEDAVKKHILKRTGKAVSSASEAIWCLYKLYGSDGFKFLDGWFSGVLFTENGITFFSGKASGPTMYYYSKDGVIIFLTELKSAPKDYSKIRQFEELISCHSKQKTTCLENFFKVQPGYVVEIYFSTLSDPVVKERLYYSVEGNILLVDEAETSKKIREKLSDAVFGMQGNRATCLISGGLDSSIIATLANERFSELQLVSIGTEEKNEFKQSSVIAQSLGKGFDRIYFKEAEMLATLPETVSLLEHCHSTFIEYILPVNLAHLNIKDAGDIILSGYGSDIIFAGFAKPSDSTRDVAELVKEEYESTFWSNEASQTLGGVINTQVGYPFFDSKVIDLAFSIDPHLFHKNGTEKYILRQAFKELLPKEIVNRTKLGVHQGTGLEDSFSSLLSKYRSDLNKYSIRIAKDKICYKILEKIVVDKVSPSDIDIEKIVVEHF